MSFVPDQAAFTGALDSIWDQLSQVEQQLLRMHYLCPGHRITARELASRVGFHSFGAANLHYGKLAGKLAQALNWTLGDQWNLSALATFVRPKAEGNDEWIFTMRPELAAALEQLGKVRSPSQRTLRIVTWNCHCGPASKKLAAALSLEPDLLVMPEFPRPQLLIPGRMAWTGVQSGSNPKGILIYADREYRVRELRQPRTSDPQHFLGVEVGGPLRFNLLAVWAKPDLQKRTYAESISKALDLYQEMFVQDSTIVAGDLNCNTMFRTGKRHVHNVDSLKTRGLISAYHAWTDEAQGKESKPTFRHFGSRHGAYHIDFCFVPEKWVSQLAGVEVGQVERWRRLSDHAPVVVDVKLG